MIQKIAKISTNKDSLHYQSPCYFHQADIQDTVGLHPMVPLVSTLLVDRGITGRPAPASNLPSDWPGIVKSSHAVELFQMIDSF